MYQGFSDMKQEIRVGGDPSEKNKTESSDLMSLN